MTRFRPKRWLRPRSRRHRETHSGTFTVADVLKDIWSDGWQRPAWARLALDRGWMTNAEYFAIEPERTGPTIRELLYERPFFGLLPRTA